MSDSSDEQAPVQDEPEDSEEPDPTDGSDPETETETDTAPETEELTTEELRRQVEEKYDFFRFHIHSV